MPLLQMYQSVSPGSGTTIFRKLQLPAIPLVALSIRQVHVWTVDTATDNFGWALSHRTDHVDLASASFGDGGFFDTSGFWLMGGWASGGESLHVSKFALREFLVAGPQTCAVANASGNTKRIGFNIFYEHVAVNLLSWTLLKSRTSFEET